MKGRHGPRPGRIEPESTAERSPGQSVVALDGNCTAAHIGGHLRSLALERRHEPGSALPRQRSVGPLRGAGEDQRHQRQRAYTPLAQTDSPSPQTSSELPPSPERSLLGSPTLSTSSRSLRPKRERRAQARFRGGDSIERGPDLGSISRAVRGQALPAGTRTASRRPETENDRSSRRRSVHRRSR